MLRASKPACEGQTGLAWPVIELDQVPSPVEARRLAAEVRRHLLGSRWLTDPVDLLAACRAGDIQVEQRQLRAAQGGIEAMLRPNGPGFAVVIDSEPHGGWEGVPATVQADVDRHRTRFRLAHELAHTFFYARSADGPRRRVRDSDEQETFCDLFARELLVPYDTVAGMPASAEAVRTVQEQFDVSMQVAARAVSAAHPEAAFWLLVGALAEGALDLQWRSRASYASGLTTAAAVSAVQGGPQNDASAWSVTAMPERRQALVFAAAA